MYIRANINYIPGTFITVHVKTQDVSIVLQLLQFKVALHVNQNYGTIDIILEGSVFHLSSNIYIYIYMYTYIIPR